VRLSTFIWITVAAFVAAFFSQLLGWGVVRSVILVTWVVFVLVLVWSRGMRGASVLTLLSVGSLVGAVVSQYADLSSVRGWFLLAWAGLLLPVATGLFSHPMRAPAWGLFVGFWGVVGVVWLIVLQILVVAGLLGGEISSGWAGWPLALIGIWFVIASGLGFGAERFPRWLDALGLLAGTGLLTMGVSIWLGEPELTRQAGLFAAIAYGLWAIGLGWIFWRTQYMTQGFRGLSSERPRIVIQT
jgi:hypothetical protein